MRAKRAKQYKKLMKQFSYFGFREPYQVLVDAELVKDASRFRMDLTAALTRTLRGKAKPMITQCSIRHLYAQAADPGMASVIDLAKSFERRRCGHRPDQYPAPLSTLECLSSIVDPQSNGTNKHNYVIASQSQEVRQAMRQIKGVPLVYVSRSVMIMEPMTAATAQVRSREESSKFRDGLRKVETGKKRKRDDEDAGGNDQGVGSDAGEVNASDVEQETTSQQPEKKKKRYGPKGPNPLSVKKSTKKPANDGRGRKPQADGGEPELDTPPPAAKRKRRRKHKAIGGGENDQSQETPVAIEE